MRLPFLSPARPHLNGAKRALAAAQPDEALRLVGFGFNIDAAYKPLYRLAAECLERLGGGDVERLFRDALARFSEALPFDALGRHFLEAGQPRLAVPFLERALRLAPENGGTTGSLAAALTADFQPERAVRTP